MMWFRSRGPGCTLDRKRLEISQIEQNGKTRIICGLKRGGGPRVKDMRLVAGEVREEDRTRAALSLSPPPDFIFSFSHNLHGKSPANCNRTACNHLKWQSGSPEIGIQGLSLSQKAEFLFMLVN